MIHIKESLDKIVFMSIQTKKLIMRTILYYVINNYCYYLCPKYISK